MGSNDKGASVDELQIIDHEAFGADLARRREALNNPDMPRNSGTRRTPSKRALLPAIEKAGGRW